MKTGLRVAWSFGVLVGAVATLVCAQSPVVAAPRAQVLLSSGGVGVEGSQAGNAMREIVDPHNGMHWLLLRQNTLPGGPGRLVLVAGHREGSVALPGAQRVGSLLGTQSSLSPGTQMDLNMRALPVIRSGDRLTVEEHTAHVDAVLEGRAMGAAAVGAVLEARLTIGGGVVRVVALGPGRATMQLGTGVRP